MSDKYQILKKLVIGYLGIEIVVLIFFYYLYGFSAILFPLIAATINGTVLTFVTYCFLHLIQERVVDISRILGSEAKDAFDFGEIGIVTYDEDYMITWMSELFEEREIDCIGKKSTMWIPELNELFHGDTETIRTEIDGSIYEIQRKEDAQILFFKDISKVHRLEEDYEYSKVVLGLVHLDNYEETIQYEEEQMIALINTKIRQQVVEWANNKKMVLRRLKNDRFLIVLNEKIFKELVDERFSILNDVRKASQDMDVAITLSMAFARGSKDFSKLDEMLNSLLELAQARGGDQVAIRKYGEDVKYFGGNSEAQEKRSRVRVRIMAQTLRDLIERSSNVIILGHKEMDFDCMGAAVSMSRIVQLYDKQVCILSRTGGIESKLQGAMELFKETLNKRHLFVSEMEAMNQLRSDTLVIMVDHHTAAISNGSQILNNANKIAVIDHHRRAAELDISPIFAYIEAGASSASEMITELLPYQIHAVDIDSSEATLMLAGIFIDTNRFKMRTGSRTFDAASQLRKLGADPVVVDDMLKDRYNDFEMKTSILKYCEKEDNGVILVPVKSNRILSRSLISQAADQILTVKEVEAVFVIAMIDEKTCGISARSNGQINVQVIMEKMNGGGHRTGAALQRENGTVDGLKEELKSVIQQYFIEEGYKNESNISK